MSDSLNAHAPDTRTALPSRIDHPSLEIICSVVHRSLRHRYRGIAADVVRDAVQEAVCRLCEQRGFRSEVNSRTVYAWLYTTAARHVGYTLRHDGRRILVPYRTRIASRLWEHARDAAQSAVEMADVISDGLTCAALLGHLSDTLAEAVQLHCDGYTADEIAERVGCSRAAAYKRVQRGCLKLRELWQREEVRVRDLS